MKIVSFSPFEQMDSLRNQIDRVFADFEDNNHSWQPAVELIDRDDSLILRMPLAGISQEDLDIEVTRESVTVAGKRYRLESKSYRYLYSELNYGKFRRQIKLPVPIINTQVKANYDAGMLTLTLPKVEEAKQRVVKINLANAFPNAVSLPESESVSDEAELATA